MSTTSPSYKLKPPTLEIADITPNQYLMWERRQSRWWEVAKGLSAFIKTVRRRNVGKENGIQDPQEKTLFMENL